MSANQFVCNLTQTNTARIQYVHVNGQPDSGIEIQSWLLPAMFYSEYGMFDDLICRRGSLAELHLLHCSLSDYISVSIITS